MSSLKKNYSSILKHIVDRTLRIDANSTTCMIYHQPKAPSELKKFSKIENDK